jgi:predicted Zn-dependent protease
VPDGPTGPSAALGGVATGLAAAFDVAGGRGHQLHGSARRATRSTFLASSTGLRLRHDQVLGHVDLTGRATEPARSSWAAAPATDPDEALVLGLYEQVAQRLAWSRRQCTLPPGRYDTVLAPAAVADLMNYVYFHAGARPAIEGRSVYSAAGGGTRLGEKLSPAPLTLRGDPTAPGSECPPFVLPDAEDEGMVSIYDAGLALRPTDWISDGVLAALVQSRHTAQLTGLPVTPHIDNLILTAPDGRGDAIDLAAGLDRGLLLTALWYIREVDPATLLLTGLTRDGTFLVEGGEVVGAVGNFRFAESPVELLGRVLGVGHTVPVRPREWADAFTHSAMPALRVADFTLASSSQAV